MVYSGTALAFIMENYNGKREDDVDTAGSHDAAKHNRNCGKFPTDFQQRTDKYNC
jgi:hypothetical protein